MSAAAQEVPYPGKLIVAGTSLYSSYFWGDGFSGAETNLALNVSFPHIPGLYRLSGGYGYITHDGATALPMPVVSGGWGFPVVADTFVFMPFVGLGIITPVTGSGPPSPVGVVYTEVQAGVRIHGSSYVHVFAMAGYAFQRREEPGAGFRGGVGIGLSSAGVARLPVLRPKGRLKIEPDSMFSPDGDGENDELFISYRIPHRENVVSAVLRVLDQNGHPFRTWGQLQEMAGTIVWKGLSDTADGPPESVSSASDYTIELETVDILGRTSVSRKTFRVDVLVVKDGDTYKIRIPSIQFPPNSADFTQLTDKTAIARNKEIISRLAAIFLKFPEYRITIAGHANSDYFDDIDKMQAEQEKVLIPLSYSRAEMVRDMLIQAGVRPEILRVSGYGAALPLVPFQDKMQRWKNRRVEFILEK